MDLITNIYTAVRTWCQVEVLRLSYWASCIVAFFLGTPRTLHSPSKSHPSQVVPTSQPPVPDEVPSIVDIKRILPKHCFTPCLRTSFYYVAKDFFYISVLYSLQFLVGKLPFVSLYYMWTPVFIFLQGTLFWALFVLGHDCGHGSFSAHPLLNDVMGTILHTVIMVPYYPWKLSHKHHHKNTGNMDKDEIFYPVRDKDVTSSSDGKFVKWFGLGLGWFIYLVVGFSPRKICHFNPLDHLFTGHSFGCVSSIVSMGAWTYLLYLFWLQTSFYTLCVYYVLPVCVFATWLVVVTFLHHMDTGVPWYSTDKWNFVKGQLSSVDRHYGWAHELTHNIGTHQIHHLFSKIPHYYLEEASDKFREAFPHLIRASTDSIMPAFFKNFDIFDAQRQVRDDTDVHVWKGDKLKSS